MRLLSAIISHCKNSSTYRAHNNVDSTLWHGALMSNNPVGSRMSPKLDMTPVVFFTNPRTSVPRLTYEIVECSTRYKRIYARLSARESTKHALHGYWPLTVATIRHSPALFAGHFLETLRALAGHNAIAPCNLHVTKNITKTSGITQDTNYQRPVFPTFGGVPRDRFEEDEVEVGWQLRANQVQRHRHRR